MEQVDVEFRISGASYPCCSCCAFIIFAFVLVWCGLLFPLSGECTMHVFCCTVVVVVGFFVALTCAIAAVSLQPHDDAVACGMSDASSHVECV